MASVCSIGATFHAAPLRHGLQWRGPSRCAIMGSLLTNLRMFVPERSDLRCREHKITGTNSPRMFWLGSQEVGRRRQNTTNDKVRARTQQDMAEHDRTLLNTTEHGTTQLNTMKHFYGTTQYRRKQQYVIEHNKPLKNMTEHCTK